MKIEHSFHWKIQRIYRPEITDEFIEYCVLNSPKLKDRYWKDAFNGLFRVPPSGRLLKVVYKEIFKGGSKTIKVITDFWIE